MKSAHLSIVTLSVALFIFASVVSASDTEIPEWQKDLQKRIENSMEKLEQHKMGEKFYVTSHKQKSFEFVPGTQTNSEYEVLNVYKNGNLLFSIWAGDDGGHQFFIHETLENGKKLISLMASDMDGDGRHDNLDRNIYDSDGKEIKSTYDYNNDGIPDLIIDRLNKKSFVGINGEIKELIKKDKKRFVKINGALIEVKFKDKAWKVVQEKHITN